MKTLPRYSRVPSAWLVGLVCAWLMLLGVRSEASALAPPAAVKNLAAWYDASDNTTLTTSGSGVTQWTDLSGNGETLTAVSGAYPTVSTINGLGAIFFSSSSSGFQTSDTDFSRLLVPESTVFIVQNEPDSATNRRVFTSTDGVSIHV